MYLRGLGLGMIVTALVLSFGIKSENKTMTDAEVRARAKELGMVEESEKLKDAVSKEAVNGEEAAAEVTDSANEDEPAEEVTEPNEVKADGTDKSEEPVEVKKPEATKDDAGKPEEVTEEPIKESSPEEKVEDDKDAAEIDNKKEEIKEAARDEKKSEDDKSKKVEEEKDDDILKSKYGVVSKIKGFSLGSGTKAVKNVKNSGIKVHGFKF